MLLQPLLTRYVRDDVVGLDREKAILRSAVVARATRPELGSWRLVDVDTSSGAAAARSTTTERYANCVLLYGAPGTGKTMLARALADALQAPVVGIGSVHGAVVARAVRDAFDWATRQERCTILVEDERDQAGVGGRRTRAAAAFATELLLGM